MSKNIEIEAKTMIKESEYNTLIEAYESEDNKIYKQENYYFDFKTFDMHSYKLGMRIRRKGDFIELTVKEDLDEGRLEINQTITEDDFNIFLKTGLIPDGEVYNHIYQKTKAPKDALIYYALLVTYRLDLSYRNCLISIDKSIYNGITDYEVECESNNMNNAKEVLEEFLAKKKIPYLENHVSKLKRARESILKAR